ncbi:MAG TPA: hypothetical protein VFD32_24185 [Dehalococcoidia bacterium]|nr:hypothetical protein [Dehalococcoidia bacterium]
MFRRFAIAGLGLAALLTLCLGGASVSGATAPYTVYGDALTSGWTNWSWDSTVTFNASSPVYSGSRAIAWTANQPWAGLYLHTGNAVSSSPYAALSFALRATRSGQKVSVVLQDVDDNPIGSALKLASYGGDPLAGAWKMYSLSLNALGAAGKGIGGVIIQDESGSSQPALYVDEIRLTPGSGGTSTPTATPPPTRTPSPSPTATASPSPTAAAGGTYPWHTNITAVIFWIGEDYDPNSSNGSQAISAYDSKWQAHFGGCDGDSSSGSCETEHLSASNGYFPLHITPHENPYYLDLPFDDLNDSTAYRERCQVIPWANQPGYAGHCTDGNQSSQPFSYMKNRWVHLRHDGRDCYGQVEDAGPYVYHDANYVFSTSDARPSSSKANHAGLDVSPALRDCLGFTGSSPSDQLNNQANTVDWQFVDASAVPAGFWTRMVTASPVTP